MVIEARQHMIAVLPHGFSDDKRRVRMYLREDVHAHALVINKSVL
jgi:hypothetical protein